VRLTECPARASFAEGSLIAFFGVGRLAGPEDLGFFLTISGVYSSTEKRRFRMLLLLKAGSESDSGL
jgi:hypothetical protein